MLFDYQECRVKFLEGIHASLLDKENYIKSIEKTAQGNIPATGISLGIYPWHQYWGISLRLSSDEKLYNSAEWKHHEFISSNSDRIDKLKEAAKYMSDAYMSSSQSESRNLAHLIFLAGAEALVDISVANRLRSFGFDAPTIDNQLPSSHYFKYMVFDGDKTIHANYCEIIQTIRATESIVGMRIGDLLKS